MNPIDFELDGVMFDKDRTAAFIAAYDRFARAERRRTMLADFFGISAAKISWRKDYELSEDAMQVIRALRLVSRRESFERSVMDEINVEVR